MASQNPGSSAFPGSSGAVERFRPTSGRFTGIVLLAASLGVGVLAVSRPDAVVPEAGVGAVFVAILAWAVTLRPRVSLVGDRLELRGPLDTVDIPLAAVEEMAVRQMLAVRAGDRRYVSAAVGRSRRQLVKDQSPGAGVPDPDTDPHARLAAPSYAQFVEERIRQRVDDARAAAGIRRGSPEQIALGDDVRRRLAWPEIVGLVASLAAFVIVIAW